MNTDRKLTLLIALWIVDKIIMLILTKEYLSHLENFMKLKKISDYVAEEWAKEKGMSIKDFMDWVKARPGWKKIKKFWKGLDNEV